MANSDKGATRVDRNFKFKETAKRFPSASGPGAPRPLDERLTDVYDDMLRHNAVAAASRLQVLDRYAAAATYNPATLLHEVNLEQTHDDLEEATFRNVRILSLVRNVLALAPLVITWITLGLATGAYQQYYAQHAIQGSSAVVVQPFIVAWESGFDNRLPFTFSEVAIADFILLSVLMVLTGWLHYAEIRSAAIVNDIFQRLDNAVHDFLTALSAKADVVREGVDPKDWAAAVAEALRNAADEVGKVARESAQASEDARKAIQSLQESAGRTLAQVHAADEAMIREVQREANAILGKLDSTTVQLGKDLGDYSSQTSKLTVSAGEVSVAAEKLATSARNYGEVGREIDTHIQAVQQGQDRFVEGIDTAAGAMAATANALTGQTLEQLLDLVQRVAAASKSLGEAQQELAQTQDAMRQWGGFRPPAPGPWVDPSGGAYGPAPVDKAPIEHTTQGQGGGFFSWLSGLFGRRRGT